MTPRSGAASAGSARATRDEIRAWLRATLPASWPEGGTGAWVEEWRREFYAQGWAVPTWPPHLGGLGLDAGSGDVVNEELARVDAPVPYNVVTVRMIGTVLMAHATPEQQERLLPDLARGRAVWCQLFSEPGSGSDLASLACRAVPEGAVWRVDGQKVWSSFASLASWGLLLARTNPAVPKRDGITVFALPMNSPGVTVRPLRQMTGDDDFSEVFLDDVEVADDNRIGAVDAGWRVARSALSSERSALGGSGASPVGRVGGVDVDVIVGADLVRDGASRDELARAWARERVVELLSMRLADRPASAALVKLAQALSNQALQSLAANLLGPISVANDGRGLPASIAWGLLRCRANTIGGGTSEVLRSLIGEQLLGLPREPDPFAGAAWRDIPRS